MLSHIESNGCGVSKGLGSLSAGLACWEGMPQEKKWMGVVGGLKERGGKRMRGRYRRKDAERNKGKG